MIVDGGSTDGTVDVIRRYEEHLAWWVSEPDEGQTDAINKGIERTSGEVVAYINSDDYFLPGAFDRAIELLESTDAMYVGGAVLDLDTEGRLTEIAMWRPEPPERYEEHFPRGRQWWLVVPFYLPQSSVFWRREVFESHGMFSRDLHYVFDGEFMCRLALAGEKLVLIPGEALSVRGVHEQQKSHEPLKFRREINTFPTRLRHSLTRWERLKLRPVVALHRMQVYSYRDQLGGRWLGTVAARLRVRPGSYASPVTCWSTCRRVSGPRSGPGIAAGASWATLGQVGDDHAPRVRPEGGDRLVERIGGDLLAGPQGPFVDEHPVAVAAEALEQLDAGFDGGQHLPVELEGHGGERAAETRKTSASSPSTSILQSLGAPN